MRYRIEYAALCVQGTARKKNEDNLLCQDRILHKEHSGTGDIWQGSLTNDEKLLFCVFDGLGGQIRGETASYLAAESFRLGLQSHDIFCPYSKDTAFANNLCRKADRDIRDYSGGRISMGSTVSGVLFGEDEVTCFHVGDCRIYRQDKRSVVRLTKDHVFEIPGPGRKVLSQVLGLADPEMEVSPDISELEYKDQTKYLVCTNGISRALTGREIAKILCDGNSIENQAKELVDSAVRLGSRDDITVILCKLEKE